MFLGQISRKKNLLKTVTKNWDLQEQSLLQTKKNWDLKQKTCKSQKQNKIWDKFRDKIIFLKLGQKTVIS